MGEFGVANVDGTCWHRYGSWIQYWTHVCVALANFHQDNPLTLRSGFWTQTRVDVQTSEASILENEEVCEEFDVDNNYVKPAGNRPLPFLCIVVDCHEDYMLIMCLGDETYAKPMWVANFLSKSN